MYAPKPNNNGRSLNSVNNLILFLKLCSRVRKKDIKAVEILKKRHAAGEFVAHKSLAGLFVWSDAPEGRNYWRNLHKQLGGWSND